MKLRYKKLPQVPFYSNQFNIHSLNEILTGEDSAYIHDLEAWIEAKQEWKCLQQAFIDRDVITDNYNTWFFEPKTEADRKRGYTLY